MFAIFEHKKKQYKVSKGDVVKLPKQNNLKKGDKIKFDNIIFVKNNDNQVQIGSPIIKGCVVANEIIEQIRDKKIIVFKKKKS